MMAGYASAQFIGILLSPIITRLYLPEHFGIMAVVISSVSVLHTISCMRYETAIVLPETDAKAHNLLSLCIIITLFFTFSLFIALPFLDDKVEAYTNVKNVKFFLYLIPIGVFSSGMETAFRFWFTRKKNFPLLSKMRAVIPLTASGIKILAGVVLGSSAAWLIIGDTAGMFVVFLILALSFAKSSYPEFKGSVTKQNMKAVAAEYKKFPIYNSATALMNEISVNLPAFLFAYFFSLEFVGFYSLAAKTLKKPIQLISNSVRGVFLQRYAEIQNKGKSSRSSFVKATLVLAAVGVLLFGIIAFSGKWVFALVFGAKWADAGVCAQYLSPWLFMLFINSPANQIILVKQKLSIYLVYQIMLLASRAAAIALGYFLFKEALLAVALFSGVGVVANLVLIFYAYLLTGNDNSATT